MGKTSHAVHRLLLVVGKTMVADPQELGLYYQSYYGVGSDEWDGNPQR
jgi:hypothetical protein